MREPSPSQRPLFAPRGDTAASGADAAGLTREKHRASASAAGSVGRGAAGGLRAPRPAARGRLPAGRQTLAHEVDTARARCERALAGLGCETALDTAARYTATGRVAAAAALRRWVNTDLRQLHAVIDLASRAAPERRANRHLRVAMCGVAFVARRAGVVAYARRACKDRICPHCGRRRRQRFTAKLRGIIRDKRSGDMGATGVLYFATFTARKLERQTPAQALDSRLAGFRRFRHHARRWLLGGVRSMEVTARRAGFILRRPGRRPYRVNISGVHAHLHCILEVRPGTTEDEVWEAWHRAEPDSARAAFDLQLLDDENVYQVGSYCLDMSGLLDYVDVDRAYVGEVLAALHGRRLVAPFGSWRVYDMGLREPPGETVYGDRSVAALAVDPTGWVRWHDGREDRAEDVLIALQDGPRQPFDWGETSEAARGPPPAEL